jgi:hypothetical protein
MSSDLQEKTFAPRTKIRENNVTWKNKLYKGKKRGECEKNERRLTGNDHKRKKN